MSYRVHVEYAFNFDGYRVHIANVGSDGTYVVKPYDLIFDKVEDGVETPDARMAAEVLAREQDRVDKMIDHLTTRPHALDRPTL